MKFKYLSKREDYEDQRGHAQPTSKDKFVMLLNNACDQIDELKKELDKFKQCEIKLNDLKKILVLIYEQNKKLNDAKRD